MNKQSTILAVDDDSRNIFALSAVLRSRSKHCITCSNMQEALDILNGDMAIDIVLLDMMMPEMDGYEAIPIIKKIPHRQALPIIAVTAQAMKGDREKCIAAGADDYISKPVDTDLLMAILSKYLS